MTKVYTVENIPKCPLCGSTHGDYDLKGQVVWCSDKSCNFYENECLIELWILLDMKSSLN